MRVQELFDLTRKVAIVTGGGTGLGRQMADALAESGVDVVLCARKAERCEQVADELAHQHGVRECDLGVAARAPVRTREQERDGGGDGPLGAAEVGDEAAGQRRGGEQTVQSDVGEIVAGPLLVRRGMADDGDVDEAGVARLELIAGEPHPLERGRTAGGEQHVGVCEQLGETLPAGLVLQVEPEDRLARGEPLV